MPGDDATIMTFDELAPNCSACPVIVVEGVSASRTEWLEHLSFSIWIEASADVCRERRSNMNAKLTPC